MMLRERLEVLPRFLLSTEKVPVNKVETESWDDSAEGLAIDEELSTEADLLSAFSPPEL